MSSCTTTDCEQPAAWRWSGAGPRGREWHGASCEDHIDFALRIARQSGYDDLNVEAITADELDEVMPAD